MQVPNEVEAGGLSLLFEAHRPELLRFLRARCGDDSEAEDLLQDLWIRLAGLRTGPIANGRAYLFRIANNMVLDCRRARVRAMARDRLWSEDPANPNSDIEDRADPAEPADHQLAREQESAILQRAISALPPGAQHALRLFRFEGLGQSEIAGIMGISRSGVEKHLAAAMKNLRAALADCGLFEPTASKLHGAARSVEEQQ